MRAGGASAKGVLEKTSHCPSIANPHLPSRDDVTLELGTAGPVWLVFWILDVRTYTCCLTYAFPACSMRPKQFVAPTDFLSIESNRSRRREVDDHEIFDLAYADASTLLLI